MTEPIQQDPSDADQRQEIIDKMQAAGLIERQPGDEDPDPPAVVTAEERARLAGLLSAGEVPLSETIINDRE